MDLPSPAPLSFSFSLAAAGQPDKREAWLQYQARLIEKLRREIPDIMTGAKLLGQGRYGLVVSHEDGTASKVFLRHRDSEKTRNAQATYEQELKILHRLDGTAFDSARTPHVISEETFPTKDKVFAVYRMTEFHGRETKWNDLLKTDDPETIERHFRNVGRVLADFHTKGASLLADVTPPPKGLVWGETVDRIPGADAKINKALEICDDYLQTHKEPGVSHGDFHPYNFKIDNNARITGLFDLSFAGISPNRLIDFTMIPPAGLPPTISEYEKYTGKTVDPALLTITKASQDTAVINWHTQNPRGNAEITEGRLHDLTQRLDTLSHITGINFSASENPVLTPTASRPQAPNKVL